MLLNYVYRPDLKALLYLFMQLCILLSWRAIYSQTGKTAGGRFYSAFIIFGNQQLANEAYENLDGKQEEVQFYIMLSLYVTSN